MKRGRPISSPRIRRFSKGALGALAKTSYSTKTINADRNQKSFKLSFDEFMAKRGGRTIASKGKSLKRSNAALFQRIEARYGVPAGPLIAIWGMETGFGSYMGNQNTLLAVATLRLVTAAAPSTSPLS